MPIPTAALVLSLLRPVWGRDVEAGPAEPIPPWSVARFKISGGPLGSVITKWVRDGDPDHPGARAHPSQLTTEAVALDFLAGLDVRAPRLIAADRGILIMEDFPAHRPLDRLIRERGYTEQTRTGLLEAARLLADRHARTAGRSAAFYRALADRRPVDQAHERRRFLARGWELTSGYAAGIGCPPGDRAVAEAADVFNVLDRPGPFLALSNGDSATNNVLVGSPTDVIIDYEFAGYRHCLSDLTDFYLPGPRWVTVVDAVESGFEDVYRSTLAPAIPAVTDDDRFGRDLAAAGLTHAFGRLGNFPKIDNRAAGDRSRLERLITIESAAALAESRSTFPALADWCRDLGRTLRRRWPETDVRTDDLLRFLPRG
ncbi:hypothetical protein [Microlunatus speluncae]|uniref:hypothetical protein n=1 Tax=Microlunatus speluncae TaxID=2594267 RepID=UPI0012665658|nr:hypothetical protein [Microlunatus speluncae]